MKKNKLISTLVLTLSLTLISPFVTQAKAAEKPDIKGTSAITLDYETGEIIYAKNVDTKAYPASTTKLLTALLFAEHNSKTDKITYTAEAKAQKPFSLNTNFQPIPVGETMIADDVMKALLLYSANDSAFMIADNVGGSSENFMKLMNEKLQALNLNHSHFVTPNGLDDGPGGENHVTTAYELSMIGKAAYHNDWVREVMSTKESTITINKTAKFKIENRNSNLGINGCIGGKTGFTTKAGRCLVSLYERDGRKIISVVLNSGKDINNPKVFKDTEAIVDYSYDAEKVPVLKSGSKVSSIKVDYKPFKFFGPTRTIAADVVLQDDLKTYDNEINTKEGKATVDLSEKDAWSFVSKPNINVSYIVRDNSINVAGKVDISMKTIILDNIVLYGATLLALIIIITLIVLIIRFKKKRKKGFYY